MSGSAADRIPVRALKAVIKHETDHFRSAMDSMASVVWHRKRAKFHLCHHGTSFFRARFTDTAITMLLSVAAEPFKEGSKQANVHAVVCECIVAPLLGSKP